MTEPVATKPPVWAQRMPRWVHVFTVINCLVVAGSLGAPGGPGPWSLVFPWLYGSILLPGLALAILGTALIVSISAALYGETWPERWRRGYAALAVMGSIVWGLGLVTVACLMIPVLN